tara:strand:+ start:711 stop:1265 length:555 start_codon:yes stop_codon:yes gene_type:complete
MSTIQFNPVTGNLTIGGEYLGSVESIALVGGIWEGVLVKEDEKIAVRSDMAEILLWEIDDKYPKFRVSRDYPLLPGDRTGDILDDWLPLKKEETLKEDFTLVCSLYGASSKEKYKPYSHTLYKTSQQRPWNALKCLDIWCITGDECSEKELDEYIKYIENLINNNCYDLLSADGESELFVGELD